MPTQNDKDTNGLEVDETTYQEIDLLWYQFRVADLNVFYYGDLVRKRNRQKRIIQISTGVLSFSSSAVLAIKEFQQAGALYAAVASLLAGILSVAFPYLGWDAETENYSHLRRSYLDLEN